MTEFMAISLGLTGLTAILFWIGFQFMDEEDYLEMQIFHFGAGYFFFLGTVFSLGKISEAAELEQLSLVLTGVFWIAIIVFTGLVAWILKDVVKSVIRKITEEYPESGG